MAMDRDYTAKLLRAVSPSAPGAISDPQTVLHAAYNAVVQGNFDAFSDAVTEDVELNVSGFSPMDGVWRGRREVVDATRRNFALVAGQQPEVEEENASAGGEAAGRLDSRTEAAGSVQNDSAAWRAEVEIAGNRDGAGGNI